MFFLLVPLQYRNCSQFFLICRSPVRSVVQRIRVKGEGVCCCPKYHKIQRNGGGQRAVYRKYHKFLLQVLIRHSTRGVKQRQRTWDLMEVWYNLYLKKSASFRPKIPFSSAFHSWRCLKARHDGSSSHWGPVCIEILLTARLIWKNGEGSWCPAAISSFCSHFIFSACLSPSNVLVSPCPPLPTHTHKHTF